MLAAAVDAIAVALKAAGLPSNEPDDAVTPYTPTLSPSVNLVEACPSAPVMTLVSLKV
jgi:hypothetical protein